MKYRVQWALAIVFRTLFPKLMKTEISINSVPMLEDEFSYPDKCEPWQVKSLVQQVEQCQK